MAIRPELDRYWASRVEALAPRSDKLSWLRVGWVDHWNRWVVYQMIPNYAIGGHLWDKTYQPWRSKFWARIEVNPGLVTWQQYELFKETDCFPSLWWVVQGSRGGHRRKWTPIEQKVMQINGFPKDPPMPGELPYAPVDQRVVDQIGPLDRLHRWQQVTLICDQTPDQLDRDKREEAIHANRELWKLMQRQADEWIDFGHHEFRSLFDQLPKGRAANKGRRTIDYEKDEQALIEGDTEASYATT